ncbi:MAG: CotH kinase family protein, partial [Chitinophagaceae bacterium]|nr:CotH kinase family protein [Oligoflexus sp.]
PQKADQDARAAQIARFTVLLDSLDNDIKGVTPEVAANNLVSGGGRYVAFNLQALGRLYEDQDAQFKDIRKNYKNLEDAIGQYGKYNELIDAAKEKNIAQTAINALTVKRDDALQKLKIYLVSSTFVPADGSNLSYSQKIRNFLETFAWQDRATDRAVMLGKLNDEINTIKSTQYDFTKLEKGNGVHEFRRKMRWFSMEAFALHGLVTLKPMSSSCPVPSYADVLSDPIATNRYAVLPATSYEPNPVSVTPCLYIEVAKLINDIGLIKSDIELEDNSKPDKEVSDLVAPADQKSVQKILDGVLKSNVFGLLQAEISRGLPILVTAPDAGLQKDWSLPKAQLAFYAKNKVHEVVINSPQFRKLAAEDPVGGVCGDNVIGKQYDWFHFEEMVIDGVTFKDIGAKKKSWCGSESKTKPSMNIDLAKYTPDNKKLAMDAFGTDTLILNNSKQDESYIRQCFAYRLYEAAGIPSALCNFMHVTVNGRDMGVYINLQPMEKAYLHSKFGPYIGNSYEPSFKDLQNENIKYYADNLTTYKVPADKSLNDLQGLIDVLHTDPLKYKKLSAMVDIPYFINYWAMEIILADWDAFTWNNNNTYLYFPPAGKMRLLPWGKDQILSIQQDERMKPRYYVNNLLARRLFDVPEINAQLMARINLLLYWYYDEEAFSRAIMEDSEVVRPYLAAEERAAYPSVIKTFLTNMRIRREQLHYNTPNPAPARPAPVVYPVMDAAPGTLQAPDAGPMPIAHNDPTPVPGNPTAPVGLPDPLPETPGVRNPKHTPAAITMGGRVMDGDGKTGTVQDINGNTTRIVFDAKGDTQDRKIEEMGVGVKCDSGVCVGDHVIDSNERIGDVKEVYNNGLVKMKITVTGESAVRASTTLGVATDCDTGVCQGKRGIDGERTGKITDVFDNGKARITHESTGNSYVRSTSKIGAAHRCVENICEDDKVRDSDQNRRSKIIEVFDSGVVTIKHEVLGKELHVRTFKELGLTIGCQLKVDCPVRD